MDGAKKRKRGRMPGVNLARWITSSDLPELLDVEAHNHGSQWTEADFVKHMRKRQTVGMCIERDGKIVGFMFYELTKTSVNVLNLCVHSDCRRKGIGKHLVVRLKRKLTAMPVRDLLVDLRESNVGAQLFFKAMGFRAVKIMRNHFLDTHEDGYRMRYRLPEPEPVVEGEPDADV